MIGAEQSCDHIASNGIPIVGATHPFTAGLKIRRASTLNRCALTLVALCVERVFVSIRKSLFSMTDDFSARSCRMTGGTDDETDRTSSCDGRKPFVRAKSFSRAKSHVAMYACLRVPSEAQYADLLLRRINAHSIQALRCRLSKPGPKARSQAMPLHEEIIRSIPA